MPLLSPWDGVVGIIVGIVLVLVLYSRRAKPAALQIPSNGNAETVPAHDQSSDADPEIDLARRTLTLREQAFGLDHADVAAACHILAAMYLDRGWLAPAEPLLQRALGIRTRALGPEHAEVLLTVSDLASLYTSHAAPELPVVAFSVDGSADRVRAAVRAGAIGSVSGELHARESRRVLRARRIWAG
jgi:Tetratricopeptide repeat